MRAIVAAAGHSSVKGAFRRLFCHRCAFFVTMDAAGTIKFLAVLLLLWSCATSDASRRPGSAIPTRSGGPRDTSPFGEITRGPGGKSQIAITFDGDAEAECFDDLIIALANANVHSTFFITGQFVNNHSDCAAAITKHGHEVGNHTWSHLALTNESDAVIRDELIRAEQRIIEVSGQSPKPLWRVPYGERDARVLKVAANLGYRSIYWTIDSLDGVEPKKTSQFLIDRIISKSDTELDGAIILMHVGERSTTDALPVIIADLQRRGFQLVTISKLLESPR